MQCSELCWEGYLSSTLSVKEGRISRLLHFTHACSPSPLRGHVHDIHSCQVNTQFPCYLTFVIPRLIIQYNIIFSSINRACSLMVEHSTPLPGNLALCLAFVRGVREMRVRFAPRPTFCLFSFLLLLDYILRLPSHLRSLSSRLWDCQVRNFAYEVAVKGVQTICHATDGTYHRSDICFDSLNRL